MLINRDSRCALYVFFFDFLNNKLYYAANERLMIYFDVVVQNSEKSCVEHLSEDCFHLQAFRHHL